MHLQNLVKFRQFILKVLSGNEISTSTKGHNSVINLQKLMHNNPNLDVSNIHPYAKCGQISSIVFKILSGNEILTSFKSHNSVIN